MPLPMFPAPRTATGLPGGTLTPIERTTARGRIPVTARDIGHALKEPGGEPIRTALRSRRRGAISPRAGRARSGAPGRTGAGAQPRGLRDGTRRGCPRRERTGPRPAVQLHPVRSPPSQPAVHVPRTGARPLLPKSVAPVDPGRATGAGLPRCIAPPPWLPSHVDPVVAAVAGSIRRSPHPQPFL